MGTFLSQNAALIIAFLALLVNIIVAWQSIQKTFSGIGNGKGVPLIIFKSLVIALSGTFIASIFWLMIDYLTVGTLAQNEILHDIASGAAWGIPIALLSGFLSKSADSAVITGVLTSIIILLLSGPDKILTPPYGEGVLHKQIYSIILFLLVSNIGVMSGYTGFRTRAYVDSISTNLPQS